ncbi:hypothetical protein [Nocardia araoensis]|uniref:hypothetical protein n=1 Tax=Nocardia araoensis TaxID=228600 RepID=UPI00030A1345|nr:hypothetical protein [Nocardia araoensis]
MDTPTPLQARLLKAVQNLAYDSQQLLERAHHAGHPNPRPEVVEQVRIGQRSREQCETVALAVGVPKAWIDYARAAGERGSRWQPGQVLLGSGHVERHALITALRREIHGLQDMAGIGAAYPRRVGLDGDAVARFRRVMGMTWQRLGAVSHALGLSQEERHQVWQRGHRHWATTVADQLRGQADHQLAQRWRQLAGADFTAAAMPVMVLQAAGITPDDIATQMPDSPDRMVEHAATALTTADRIPTALIVDPDRDPDPAADITAAIDAAGLTDTPSARPDSVEDALDAAGSRQELGPGPEP